ncbi:MAG: dockerin type I domain-containing protein [Candidatus Bathyarchaeota archaeon]|nr:dockerin type I domain-containing protein [Candidatus Bathyarchaeota archaeon]MDH5745473.1 dockerin type I domain-containing protein [Candidatus Bathyarchaeota archaeon]
MRKKFVPALVLLLLLPMFSVYTVYNMETSETSSTTIYVDPPTITAPFSENFTVSINIENVTELYAWQVKLGWAPQLLDLVNVIEGDFGQIIPDPALINQSEGWVLPLCVYVPGEGSGSGTFANVTFHGTSPGECVLDLYDTKLFNSTLSVPTPPYLGDVDGDGVVKIQDIARVAKVLGTSEGQPRYDPDADFNNDGFVDLFDIMCCALNNGRDYVQQPGNATQPVEAPHEVSDGYVTIYPRAAYSVTWKWLDFPDENPVWLTVNVSVYSSFPVENFNFNRSLGRISFNFTSATLGFCNVTVPKLLMDGAFKVLINNTLAASILTWNQTHTFIYFTHGQGTHNIAITGEIVTRIRSIDLKYLIDVNGDGIINTLDIASVTRRYGWKEDN